MIIYRIASSALAAVRGSGKEVRVRNAHGHSGNRAVAADWVGDDLGGLPARSRLSGFQRGARRAEDQAYHAEMRTDS